MPGVVIALDGRVSTVRLTEGPHAGEMLACELLAALRRERRRASRLVVGDRVSVHRTGPLTGIVDEVHERRTALARGRGKQAREEHVIAANVDQAVVVASVRAPEWRPGFVDRMLCAAAQGGLEALVVATKVDLAREGDGGPDHRRDLAVYERLGYRALAVSAATGEGVDALRAALAGKVSVVAGQSGVGKTTLLNAIEPGLGLRTREVSRETGKGKHTTTATHLVPLAGGGYVLDTPGVRSFGFADLDPGEARRLFPEVAAAAPGCRFRDCLHDAEPGCAVRAAVASGAVDARRYESYRRILLSLDEEDLRS